LIADRWSLSGEVCRSRQAARPRTRSVAAIGRLTGAAFALRIVVPLFCARVLHLEPSIGAAIGLSLTPLVLLLLCLHSVGAVSNGEDDGLRRELRQRPVVPWVAAYLIFAGISLSWTIAVSPVSSGVYWIALVLDAATILLLLRLYRPEDVAESVLHGYLTGACAIAALAWIMPAQTDLRLGDPDFLNTNQIANVCAFGIFFAQYLARKGLLRSWIPTLALSMTLLRTLSKTTLLAFVLSQGLLLFRDPAIPAKTRKRILLCVATVLFAASGLLASYYQLYTNAGNQAETLTGRTAIWAWAFDKVPDSPWMGHGFDSMWKIMPPFGSDRFEARHAENELLQQLYAYGIVGSILFVGVYVSLFRSIRRCPDISVRPLLTVFFIFIVVRGIAEEEPFDLLIPIWLLLLLGSLPACSEGTSTVLLEEPATCLH
jgi:exopolysaccharide production protein ExoQ